MFNSARSTRMSGILRFNIIAASGCAAYYLWKKYSNWKARQTEYCTKALELVQQYPEMKQILGKNVRLTKLMSSRSSERFTDLSTVALVSGRVRVKCEVKGTKASGQLFVWASRSRDGHPATAAPRADLAFASPPEIEAAPPMTTIFDEPMMQQQSPSPSSADTESQPGPWVIDKLALQLDSGKKKADSQQWTLYQSFASMASDADAHTSNRAAV